MEPKGGLSVGRQILLTALSKVFTCYCNILQCYLDLLGFFGTGAEPVPSKRKQQVALKAGDCKPVLVEGDHDMKSNLQKGQGQN